MNMMILQALQNFQKKKNINQILNKCLKKLNIEIKFLYRLPFTYKINMNENKTN